MTHLLAHTERSTRNTNRQPKSGSTTTLATYLYCDAAGNTLYRVIRQAPKGFLTEHFASDGTWQSGLGGKQHVLYHLPELLAASEEEVVFVVEGEKDADTLTAAGCLATTSPYGAKSFHYVAEHAQEVLQGRHVVLLPDNDKDGTNYASSVVHALQAVAASIRVLLLPDLPPKGDVTDWLQHHTVGELEELVERTPLYAPQETPLPRHDTNAPGRVAQSPVDLLLIPNWAEDRAVWRATQQGFESTTDGRLVCQALNKLEVSLVAPGLTAEALQNRVKRVRLGTLLTLLSVGALWNQGCRGVGSHQNAMDSPLEDILQLRGIRKRGGTWRREDIQEVADDLDYLALLHVRGKHRLDQANKPMSKPVDAAYASVTVRRVAAAYGTEHISGIQFAPGPWIDDYVAVANTYLSVLDVRVLRFNPQNDGHELRLALYLADWWRRQAKARTYEEPIALQKLLHESGITVNGKNSARSAERIEAALERLVREGIIGACICLTPGPRQQKGWSKQWLASMWRILPPVAVVRAMEQMYHKGETSWVVPWLEGTFIGSIPHVERVATVGGDEVVPQAEETTAGHVAPQSEAVAATVGGDQKWAEPALLLASQPLHQTPFDSSTHGREGSDEHEEPVPLSEDSGAHSPAIKGLIQRWWVDNPCYVHLPRKVDCPTHKRRRIGVDQETGHLVCYLCNPELNPYDPAYKANRPQPAPASTVPHRSRMLDTMPNDPCPICLSWDDYLWTEGATEWICDHSERRKRRQAAQRKRKPPNRPPADPLPDEDDED